MHDMSRSSFCLYFPRILPCINLRSSDARWIQMCGEEKAHSLVEFQGAQYSGRTFPNSRQHLLWSLRNVRNYGGFLLIHSNTEWISPRLNATWTIQSNLWPNSTRVYSFLRHQKKNGSVTLRFKKYVRIPERLEEYFRVASSSFIMKRALINHYD